MMERRRLHIGWLWSGIVLMLLAACSSSDDNGMEEKQPTMLTVYVYSPDRPMLIRSEVGEVDASVAEAQINKLQIWVFETETGNKVASLTTTETSLLNVSEGAAFKMIVDDDFVQRKPRVDVYVLANVTETTCGCSFDEDSSRDDLNNIAKLGSGKFGLLSLVSSVPDAGLPMAGVLKDQPVIGDAPVLRIGTQSNIATVSLARAVSKVRFVFANTQTEKTPILCIKDIQLDEDMIPDEEYLIPQNRTLTYNATPASLLPSWINEVTAVEDPMIYIYDEQEAQVYEDLITQSPLTKVGPYYLHESDKRLSGKITYTIAGGSDKEATFQMDAAGDFTRNHTWIVYAYHAGGGYLQLNTFFLKDWTTKVVDHGVYNW